VVDEGMTDQMVNFRNRGSLFLRQLTFKNVLIVPLQDLSSHFICEILGSL